MASRLFASSFYNLPWSARSRQRTLLWRSCAGTFSKRQGYQCYCSCCSRFAYKLGMCPKRSLVFAESRDPDRVCACWAQVPSKVFKCCRDKYSRHWCSSINCSDSSYWVLERGDLKLCADVSILPSVAYSQVCIQIATLCHFVHVWKLYGVSFTLIDLFLFMNMRSVWFLEHPVSTITMFARFSWAFSNVSPPSQATGARCSKLTVDSLMQRRKSWRRRRNVQFVLMRWHLQRGFSVLTCSIGNCSHLYLAKFMLTSISNTGTVSRTG